MPTAPAVSRAPALLLAACALLSSSAFAGLPNLELHFNSTPPRVVTTSCAPVSLTLTDRTGGGSTSYTVSLAAVPDDLAVDFFTDSSCNTAPVSSIPASVNGATF